MSSTRQVSASKPKELGLAGELITKPLNKAVEMTALAAKQSLSSVAECLF